MEGKASRFYLGANSPGGFFSYYPELIPLETAKAVYILKGGPGTGKSSFMRKFGDAFIKAGQDVEFITCSSDPDSTDGIVIDSLGIAFVDGTAPHVVDPVYPGACDEIINLGDFWDRGKIEKNKKEIIALSKKINGCFGGAYKYLAAAKEVNFDIERIIGGSIQRSRLMGLCGRTTKAEFRKKLEKRGNVKSRFLSGITPHGIVTHFDTVTDSYKTVYRLDDPYGIGGELLKCLSAAGRNAGYDVINCYCPSAPDSKLEHVLLPELSLAFVTSNEYHPYTGEFTRKINLERYIDEDTRQKNRKKLKFNRKLREKLIESATASIREAKELHDDLEAYYGIAMDFRKLNALQKRLYDKITGKRITVLSGK